ncbi:MAG: FAD-dependent oxidoreductase [Pseudomonadota bacterium]
MGQRVIIIGAGIAGLRCATVVKEAGLEVTLLDKARGPGGRCSTRRHQGFRFDHGAQYFTPRSPEFRRQLDEWLKQGVAARWEGRLVTIDAAGARTPLNDERERFVGVPGMNGIPKAMAEGLDCRLGNRVVSLQRTQGIWRIRTDGDDVYEAELLVMTPPPPQTAELLATVQPSLAGEVSRVVMQPCWALMLGFDKNPVDGFDGAMVADRSIAWMAGSRGKAGREGRYTWMVHGSVPYSEQNLEAPDDAVGAELFDEFCRLTDQRVTPVETVVHRWRYAMAAVPLGLGMLAERASGLWIAGDWCVDSRIEGAWRSGQAAAEDLLATVR